MANRPMLSKGWNNIGGLKRIHKLDDNRKLLQEWKVVDPRMQWFDSESYEVNALGITVPISLPRATWVFRIVNLMEHRLLVNKLSDSTRRGGYVTVNIYNATDNIWQEMNGILVLPETSIFGAEETRLQSENYTIELKELRNVMV